MTTDNESLSRILAARPTIHACGMVAVGIKEWFQMSYTSFPDFKEARIFTLKLKTVNILFDFLSRLPEKKSL